MLTFDVCLIRIIKRNKSNTREVRAQIKSGISIKVSIVTKVFSNLKKCKKICNQKIRKTENITDKKKFNQETIFLFQ